MGAKPAQLSPPWFAHDGPLNRSRRVANVTGFQVRRQGSSGVQSLLGLSCVGEQWPAYSVAQVCMHVRDPLYMTLVMSVHQAGALGAGAIFSPAFLSGLTPMCQLIHPQKHPTDAWVNWTRPAGFGCCIASLLAPTAKQILSWRSPSLLSLHLASVLSPPYSLSACPCVCTCACLHMCLWRCPPNFSCASSHARAHTHTHVRTTHTHILGGGFKLVSTRWQERMQLSLSLSLSLFVLGGRVYATMRIQQIPTSRHSVEVHLGQTWYGSHQGWETPKSVTKLLTMPLS
jgi:hypothetical protein